MESFGCFNFTLAAVLQVPFDTDYY